MDTFLTEAESASGFYLDCWKMSDYLNYPSDPNYYVMHKCGGILWANTFTETVRCGECSLSWGFSQLRDMSTAAILVEFFKLPSEASTLEKLVDKICGKILYTTTRPATGPEILNYYRKAAEEFVRRYNEQK